MLFRSEIDDDLAALLRLPDAQLTDAQRANLRRHFLLTTPELATARAEIDRLLDSGKVAAIAYDFFDLYPADAKQPGSHGDHSSVVVARRLLDGRCHYFVRNHFGPTCGYRPEYEDRCEKGNGGVWVTMDALKHLYSVTSVR